MKCQSVFDTYGDVMMRYALVVGLGLLGGCGSTSTDQSEAVLPKRNATNKISVCAPNITFVTMGRSPSLYVNDKELGKPSKNKNAIAYVAVGDEWEVTLKESIWDASSVADVEVISGQVKSSGDIFIIMARNNNWGGAIASLASGSGNVIGSAVFGALGGAVNAKNEYTPFTASKVTKSEFSKKCPG